MLGVPNSWAAGDSLSLTFSISQRPSAGWLVVYFFRGPSSLDAAAVAVGESWRLAITAAPSAALAPGFYTVAGTATRPGERVTFEEGVVEVTPNISTQVAGYDGRTHAQKVLAKIEAVLEGRADKSILRSDIDGLEIEHATHEDLLKLRAAFRAEVRAEARAKSPGADRVLVRFGGG